MSERASRHRWEGTWALLKYFPISNRKRGGRDRAGWQSGGHDILRFKWRPQAYDINDSRNREGTSADINGDQ